ncbi:hypothetical protein GIB67_016731 [Kingdonia uniflora]|uniref:Uncharacterized protein n=1 Tax=Kingdonia uniflora TaxID=39325 RepID=A0A7J7LMQ9_9MAGN|nr:hypothetical protein GIB67_016731 [Kingdonia uniflora]
MAIGGESCSSSTVSSIGTSEDVQSFNSVHDNPNLKITSQLLDGLNYVRLAQSVKLFVGGRGKIGFLLGTEKELAESDPKYAKWFSDDSIVKTWLINSIQPTISAGYLFTNNAHLIWESLRKPTTTKIYAKIVEKTQVLQFLAGINLDFEYARVHLLDRTPFPTLVEAYTLSLRSESSVTYASHLRDPFRDFCYGCSLCLSGTTVSFLTNFTYIIT